MRRNVLALLSLERYKDRDRIEPDAVDAPLPPRRRRSRATRSNPMVITNRTVQADAHRRRTMHRNWRVQIDIRLGEPVLLDSTSASSSADAGATTRCSRASPRADARQGQATRACRLRED